MPIGYLVTTSLVACCVFGALTPPRLSTAKFSNGHGQRRPFILGVLSFFAGFVLNELPFIATTPKKPGTMRQTRDPCLNQPDTAQVRGGCRRLIRLAPVRTQPSWIARFLAVRWRFRG